MLLDWIGFLPMMHFSLARNMLMHYHALHVSFLFFPMPYLLLCLCVFLLSLSFSLFIMAPKKSVPSKNLIRCGSYSSSSSFPSDSVQFHDEKAWNDFSENFSNWAIYL